MRSRELALGLHGALEALCHLIEGAAQLLELLRTADVLGSGRQLALAQAFGGVGEAAQRTRERSREPEREEQARGEAGDADREEAEGLTPGVLSDVGHRLGDPHDTGDAPSSGSGPLSP
jgi:hypothetical protein